MPLLKDADRVLSGNALGKRINPPTFRRVLKRDAVAFEVCQITDAISLDTWKKSVKPFYDGLIIKFEVEESWADAQLREVTR